ncbi:MAG: hypothetical protein JXM73_24870, partial [Anaerolineae bacterium]|nr:hypothetical protein [Anaerolineae bacterium]
ADDRLQRATLVYGPTNGRACAPLDPSTPPACAEVEVKRLAGGIGYVRISGLVTAALDGVLQALDDLHDAPALIIDLRGNPGGVFPVRKAIASHLVGEPELFMRYQHRDGVEEAYLDPVPDAYRGQVVILVDELSASSSEEFAGSLQALGRATIVGTQTPGRCLTANIAPLPHDAVLIYPEGGSQTPNGRLLEGNGVMPDIEVELDRQQLLLGVDAQLEAAVDYLEQEAAVREFQVQASDVRLQVRMAGKPGSGCVLIAINGGPGLTSNYMLDVERLAGPDCAVVTYDQRGLGKFTQPSRNHVSNPIASRHHLW